MPEKSDISFTKNDFDHFADLLGKLGCIHLYDVWLIDNIKLTEGIEKNTTDVQLLRYLSDHATSIIKEQEQEVENQEESGQALF